MVVRRTWAGRTQFRVLATERDDVVDHYQAQDYRWYRAHPTGELIAHAGVDAEAATDVLAPIPYSLGTVILIVTSTIWMIATDAVLGLLALALFPVLVLQNVLFQRKGGLPANEAQERLGEVSALVHESLEAVTVIKAFGAEEREVGRLHERASSLRASKVRLARLRATFDLFLDAVPSYANVLLVLVGASRVNAGAATLGDITSFVYLFTLLVWPLRIIGFALGDLPHSLAGLGPGPGDPARRDPPQPAGPDRRPRLLGRASASPPARSASPTSPVGTSCTTSTSTSPRGRRWPSSARPRPASRRSWPCWPACSCPTRAR